ncbi:unnamed protein product [Porites lobata]|uniref:Uncharacterized protein n=1 Tax=Porites lobata TaxID=104759 RepID=A0ABN8NK42_9CNID|nr:unnamed protein product [Porites lobata]
MKDVKLATKDTTFSLADITGFDKEVKSQTIETTAVNNGKERPSGTRAKTFFKDRDKDRGNRGEFDYENKNDAESEEVVAKSSSLPVESLVPGSSFKDFKLATKDTKLSLPVNTVFDDQVKSWTIGTTVGDNNGNKKPPGAKAKTLLTSNEYTAKVPTTSYPPSLGSKASSLRLPRVNGAELNYFYNSRIPSLDATGINQNFLARHTTDQSLQHTSQPSDFKQTRELTPPTNWPVWSLPPPAMTETNDLRHRWPQSSVVHPSVVGYQTGGQSNWNDEPPALRLPTVKSHTPVVCRKATATVTELQPSASVTSQSVPSYSYQSSVLPENRQERFLEPSIPNSFKENQEHVHPVTSPEISSLRGEDQRNGAVALSPEFPDDSSLAALERKVAEACAVVERVMKEREERTKAQREAARKKREMREQREREAREMREREEREWREREEREREERKMRERQEREIRERERREKEKKERKRREPVENEDRDTRWFGGERAPVQESPRWQCVHYQRRCLVKFPCCGIFYPCHCCHNTSGACDTDDRKANNATHVKCGICGHEEEINEGSQYCSSCGEQMAAYFCFICKHFTGVEKNPFHSDKCGICSTQKDKSFHCDVCNACLDKRLEEKHKCRLNFARDECCVCLEEAFSGCQILPCSHKVHKECAIAMIQNGV